MLRLPAATPTIAVELLRLSGDMLGGGVLGEGEDDSELPDLPRIPCCWYCDDCLPLTGLTFPWIGSGGIPAAKWP